MKPLLTLKGYRTFIHAKNQFSPTFSDNSLSAVTYFIKHAQYFAWINLYMTLCTSFSFLLILLDMGHVFQSSSKPCLLFI